MDIKIGNLVKTYNLVTGELAIGQINGIFRKSKNIICWRDSDELQYEGEKNWTKIPEGTAIWDKLNMRWVFKHKDTNEQACFSTIIVNACDYDDIELLYVDNEKIVKKGVE